MAGGGGILNLFVLVSLEVLQDRDGWQLRLLKIKEAIAHALCGANLSGVDGRDLHLLTHGVELMFARQLRRS